MLTPHRFMNLNYSILGLTASLLEKLSVVEKDSLDNLLSKMVKEYRDIDEQDVLLSVSFLYLLGKVEYCRDTDMVVLVERYND